MFTLLKFVKVYSIIFTHAFIYNVLHLYDFICIDVCLVIYIM